MLIRMRELFLRRISSMEAVIIAIV
jgi:hypothetical protein